MCENNEIKMTDVRACRVCLATDIRLYDIHKNKLNSALENLTGIKVTQSDGLPQHLCGYCSLLLLKCVKFKECCKNTHELLSYMVAQNEITTKLICSIDRTAYQQPCPPYTIKTFSTGVTGHIPTVKQELETVYDYTDDYSANDDIKSENYTSDDEPLSEKLFKKKADDKSLKKDDKFTEETKSSDTDLLDTNNENEKLDFLDRDDFLNDVEEIVLTREEQIRELEARKTSCNYLNNEFKCHLCYKGFMTESTYKNHMIRHDPKSGSYDCDICHMKWPQRRALKSHVYATHERKYNCKLCNQVCKSSFRAKEHIKWHKGYTYICKFCGTSFDKPTSYLTHVRISHPSKHCCEICGESFVSKMGLSMHKTKIHRDLEGNSVVEQFRCSRCNIQFRNLDALRRHQELAADVCMERACVHCGDSWSTDEMLRTHIKTHNKEEENVQCEMCNKIFSNSRAHAIHYQRVHVIKVKKKYKRTKGLSGTKWPMCEICGKLCKTKTSLVDHQRTHTGEKPYKCTECPKSFTVLQGLQIHKRTHTGERPYKCSYCPKDFVHKAALNRHVRVHTGSKPYTCQHCNRSFSQSNSLKGHIKTVHLKMSIPRNKKNKIGFISM